MIAKDTWIERIYIVARKTESEGFEFFSDGRPWDGFVYFISGQGFYIDGDGEPQSVGAGDIVLVRRGQRYGFSFEGGCEYVTTAFDIGEDADSVGVSVFELPVISRGRQELYPTVAALCEEESRGAGRKNLQRERICSIFQALLDSDRADGEAGADRDIERALEFIRQRYREPFGIEEMARYCSMSASYLRSRFKSAVGVSVTEYRERLRMTDARRMLESGYFDIGEIASLLGYCDVYHFSKRFSRAVGLPPGRYKKSFYTKK